MDGASAGNVFETPVVEWDPFDTEVEVLALSAYQATMDGLGRLYKRQCPRGDPRANPELQIGIDLWEEQVSAMKRQAGNMALVSLLILFEDWLARTCKRLNLNRVNWKSRFQAIEGELGMGPLSLTHLDELVNARNSLIHHSGNPKFWWNGADRLVGDRFLDFDEDFNDDRVSVSESVLKEEANTVRRHAKHWTEARRKKSRQGTR